MEYTIKTTFHGRHAVYWVQRGGWLFGSAVGPFKTLKEAEEYRDDCECGVYDD